MKKLTHRIMASVIITVITAAIIPITIAATIITTSATYTAHAQSSMMPIPPGYEYPPYLQNSWMYDGMKSARRETPIKPEAVLHISNDSGNSDKLNGTLATTFTFDGSGSSDAETPTRELEVRFDFENDGKLDTHFSRTKRAEHQYISTGWKTVRMDVLDKEGHISSTTEKIYIAENTPPQPLFTISPRVGTPGTTFYLDTHLSTDHQYDDSLLTYKFDFDGDMVFDTKYSSQEQWTHNFETPGLKTVTLQVQDPEGATSIYKQLVFIKQNTPPVASFSVNLRKRTDEYVSFMLDASNSYDKDGPDVNYDGLTYKWDFNYIGSNDIQWDTKWYSAPYAYATYFLPGEYIIRLRVKDIDGAIHEKFFKITVSL